MRKLEKQKVWVFYTTTKNGRDYLFGKGNNTIGLNDKWYFFYDMERYAFRTKRAIVKRFLKMSDEKVKILEYTIEYRLNEERIIRPYQISYVKDFLLEDFK